MKRILIHILLCVIPVCVNASENKDDEYSISSLYTGLIGKSVVTMNLTKTGDVISGSYIYDKYNKKILIDGTVKSNLIELREKTKNGFALITLKQQDKGYTGTWCDDKCVSATIKTNNSFRDGDLNNIEIINSDIDTTFIKMNFAKKNIELTIPEAIDRPTLEFVDINNDGFYDLIVTTDHRPNNGSQTIYLSEDNGFLESNILSNENGTAVYDYFKKTIVFNTKDDCCSAFNKVIYSFEHGNVIGKKSISYNYSTKKGISSTGQDISKAEFESY
ncbi:hypothetical protein LZ633_19705 [Enterobacter asburiae]|nr:hypothetical protein [Enterobacter asburiae]